MNIKHIVSALALAALLPATAMAAPIYQQGSINTSDRGAYQYAGQNLADDFIAGSTQALTNATWTGSYYGAVNTTGIESFTFELFAAGATPGALLYSFVGNASFVASTTAGYYDYSLNNLAGPILTAGTQYWVDIYSNGSPQDYAWADSSNGTAAGAISNGNNIFTSMNGNARSNHVFALNATTTVPEPATPALLALGLFGLAFIRRRKQ